MSVKMDDEQSIVPTDISFDTSADNADEDTTGCSTKPPFILLHGFAQSSKSWDEVACALRERGYTVYVPELMNAEPTTEELDMRSAFLEDSSDDAQNTAIETAWDNIVDPEEVIALGEAMVQRAYALLSSAQNMEEICDATAELVCAVTCACQCPPVLVGYSMGGRIALQTLVYYGDSLPLTALVLESAALGPRDEAERRAFSERSQQWALRLKTEGIEAFIDWWEKLPLFATQQSLPQEVRDRVRADRVGCGTDKLIRMTKGVEQHHQAYMKESFSALNDACDNGLAVLYLVGALDKRYGAFAYDMRDLARDVEVHTVSKAGHNIHLEHPEAFIAEITAWADEAATERNKA